MGDGSFQQAALSANHNISAAYNRTMKKRSAVVALVFALIGGWVGWSLSQFSAVDACLDAGGRWEDRGSYCFGARPAGE